MPSVFEVLFSHAYIVYIQYMLCEHGHACVCKSLNRLVACAHLLYICGSPICLIDDQQGYSFFLNLYGTLSHDSILNLLTFDQNIVSTLYLLTNHEQSQFLFSFI